MESKAPTEQTGSWRLWLSTLGGALVLYLAAILVSNWGFLPWFERYPFDTRWLVCSGADKLDELNSSLVLASSSARDWQLFTGFFRGEVVDPGRMDFNPIPKALIWALSRQLAPIAAYNVAVIGVWLLNGLSVCALTLHLTRCRSAAWLGGFLFAFSPFWTSIQHCRSVDYGLFFLVPLLLLLLALMRERRSWLWVLAFALGLGVLIMANQYYTLGLALMMIPWTVLLLAAPVPGGPGRWAALLRLLLAGLGGLALVSPWLVFEWGMLGVQREVMAAADINIGRSFFQPLALRPDVGPGLGLFWTGFVLLLAAAGLFFPSRRRLGERIFLAAALLLLVPAQQLIADNATEVGLFMKEHALLWRIRSCRLLATLAVFCAPLLAGLGFGALYRPLKRWSLRAPLLALAALACTLFVREGQLWWGRLVSGDAPCMHFPDALFAEAAALRPVPRLVVLSGQRNDVAHGVALYFEIRSGLNEAPPALHEELRRALATGGSLSEGSRAATELRTQCHIAIVSDAQPRPALAAAGFTTPLHEGSGWYVAHNGACR